MKNNRGFSLIELLVGIAIIITSTTIVLSIIVSSFRISNKTTTTDSVRQNGNNAISQLSRMIQFADSFDGIGLDDATAVPLNCSDGQSYYFLKITYQGVPKTISCTDFGIEIDSNPTIDGTMNVSSCSLTCQRDDDSSSPIIGINFNLSKGDSDTAPEQTSSINFSTKIKMRNNN